VKGIIFNLLEKLIVEKFGDEIMEEIYDEAELSASAPPFVGPITYPDSDLYAIISQLSQKTNIPANDLIYEYGKFVFPILIDKYPVFMKNISSPLEFLKTLNNIHHVELKKLYEDAKPPIFKIEAIDNNSAKMHYISERKLCRLVEGLLEGVAHHFEQRVTYHHLQCMKDGHKECILDITFHQPHI